MKKKGRQCTSFYKSGSKQFGSHRVKTLLGCETHERRDYVYLLSPLFPAPNLRLTTKVIGKDTGREQRVGAKNIDWMRPQLSIASY